MLRIGRAGVEIVNNLQSAPVMLRCRWKAYRVASSGFVTPLVAAPT